jgi:DNA-binding transcriptional ArsR family regulator
VSDELSPVFAALADPTRRLVVESLLRHGSTSVPELTSRLAITRQAIAKHISTLDHAGLIERASGPGRTVSYRLREGGLGPVAAWVRSAERAWDERLARLRGAVESVEGSGRER